MIISWLCYAYFTAGILGSLFAHFAQKRFGPSSLFSHGKAAPRNSLSNRNDFFSKVAGLTLSKHLFWHFYAIGLVSSLIFIYSQKHSNTSAWILMIQCLRRLIECFVVMPDARDSQMHLIHYLIGVSYYPALLVTFYLQPCTYSLAYSILFIMSSLLQFYCHYILGNVRSNQDTRKSVKHRPIDNPVFKFLHTPHYFAEFMIYFSIAGMNRFHLLSVFNLIWILTILGASAKNSADWMQKQGYKDFFKYLMIPFLF